MSIDDRMNASRLERVKRACNYIKGKTRKKKRFLLKV